MALLASQITLINSLVADLTITEAQAIDLLSTQDEFSDTQITFIKSLGLSSANEDLLLESTRITQNQLEQELEQAKVYVKAGNYNGAREQVLLAEITLAGMSNYELGNRKIEYREGIRYIRNSIDELESVASTSSKKNRRVLANYVRK